MYVLIYYIIVFHQTIHLYLLIYVYILYIYIFKFLINEYNKFNNTYINCIYIPQGWEDLRGPRAQETQTGEIPPEQSQPSLINRTVQSLRNRAQNLSDTVENIRQQITGRITNARRGRYARLATNEPVQQNEPASTQSNEPPIIDVTDEIMPLLNQRATRIQRLNRAVRQKRRNTERQYQDQISREFDENMTRSRNEELQRNQDAINELDQILRQDALKQSSATRIQSATKNDNKRKYSIKNI
jgi:hypothetical protein